MLIVVLFTSLYLQNDALTQNALRLTSPDKDRLWVVFENVQLLFCLHCFVHFLIKRCSDWLTGSRTYQLDLDWRLFHSQTHLRWQLRPMRHSVSAAVLQTTTGAFLKSVPVALPSKPEKQSHHHSPVAAGNVKDRHCRRTHTRFVCNI